MTQIDSCTQTEEAPAVTTEGAVAIGLPVLARGDGSELVLAALKLISDRGHRVGGERPFRELLNQNLSLESPRSRILLVEGSSFNIGVAVARFVWNMAGSSDLAAIAAYEPRARDYSDDGVTLPGSNVGARLLGSGDGLDQIEGIAARIRDDVNTRRGSAVVWRPEDAIRESRDIPCATALTCHVRAGALITTMTMRSNNALRLLPYNLFEFTMLAELISVEAGVKLGPYWHTAQSLHVFEPELVLSEKLVEAGADRVHDARMAAMPSDPAPRSQIALLVDLEAQLRQAAGSGAWKDVAALVRRADACLHDYWFELFSVLAMFSTARGNASDSLDVDALLGRMTPAVRAAVLSTIVGR
jgi:thymidylate synthase